MRLHVVVLMGVLGLCWGCSHGPTERPYKMTHEYGVDDPQFRRSMGNLLGPAIIEGNSITTLVNGDKIFPAMLDAIRSAKKTINFETYIYWSGQTGAQFASALSERAANGVKVRVMIDSYGSGRVDQRHLKQMEQAGAQVVKYHPVHWYALTASQKANNRTHRKLLIVDGQIGFTGGVGVADEWLGDADSPKHWRDTHYMIKGPAVAQLQAAFTDNWMETTGQVLQGDAFFPPLSEAGKQPAQVFKSSPEGDSESMELMHLLSLAAAKKNIRLASAYFVPDQLTIQTLLEARKRGVSVQIIVPGEKIDEKSVRRASRARWGEMLRSGVEIYEYQPTMFHCKLMIVDDLWVSIGSSNLDNRSFQLNDEANLNVLDRTFAQEQIRLFDEDLSKSKRIGYKEWQKRPGLEKLMEGIATIFGFLM
jgi:cardiolipin synthase A/B